MNINSFQFLIPKKVRDSLRAYYQPLLNNFISKEVKRFYSPYLSKGNLVFDIGAWEGVFTKSFSNLGCKVVSVEPQFNLYKKIKRKYKKIKI